MLPILIKREAKSEKTNFRCVHSGNEWRGRFIDFLSSQSLQTGKISFG